ncbi:MAG: hypothetical protein V1824_01885 [archaeon]
MNKLQKELFKDKDTIKFLEQIAGPLAIDIIKIYKIDEPLSPEDISKRLKKKITNVRSTLNSLHYRGIACYKKIRKEQNIFNFYWDIKLKKIIELLIEQKAEEIKQMEEVINQEQSHDYFYCPKKCVEEPFEVAAAYNFKCPNCDSVLKMADTKNKVLGLKRKKKKVLDYIHKLDKVIANIKEKTTDYVCE